MGNSAIEAKAVRNDRDVEEGQVELVVVHGEALEKRACKREPPAHEWAGGRLDAKAEGEGFGKTRD